MFMSSRDEMYPHCCMVNEFLMELYAALLFCLLWKITHVLFNSVLHLLFCLLCSVGSCYCCISYMLSLNVSASNVLIYPFVFDRLSFSIYAYAGHCYIAE